MYKWGRDWIFPSNVWGCDVNCCKVQINIEPSSVKQRIPLGNVGLKTNGVDKPRLFLPMRTP